MRTLAAGLLLFALASWAAAATYYVAPTGDDHAAGSAAAPFLTLTQAATVVKPGDTVLVRAGTYPGGISLGCHGAEGQPITFRPAGDGPVKIQGRIEPVRGFTLAPGKQKTYVAAVTGPVAGIAADLDTTPLILDGLQQVKSVDEVEAGTGRWCYDQNAGKLYVNYLNGPFEPEHTMYVVRDGEGISVSGSWLALEGFTISGFAANGVDLGNASHITLNNLRISLCGWSWGGAVSLSQTTAVTLQDCVLFRSQNALMLQACRQTQVLHDTLYRTRAHGIILYNSSGTTVRDNIIYAGGPSGSALYVGQGGEQDLHLDYNCYLDTGTAILVNWTPLNGQYATFWDYRAAIKDQDQHSLSNDPLFVSTQQGAEDFRLQAASPCRGKAEDGGDLGARGSARQGN